MENIDNLCINTIRTLTIDAVEKANSGHPGMPMGMAPAAYSLWTRHLRYNPKNPQWMNRDRFVLSCGHGSMLLYAVLYLTGYDLSLDDIKNFRQWGSKTPGHPESDLTPGVEVTTGPLGQGISNAVGMAIAEKYLAAHFNREQFPIIDYNVYVFASDGDLEEGISSEASSLAGCLGLDNLIVIYDNNHISIDGSTSLAFTEDVAKRYGAYGWFVQTVDTDGNDLEAFDRAIDAAKKEKGRPSFIKWHTHIGYGSPNKQDTAEIHGSPLGAEEVALTKKVYGWDPDKTFYVPDESLAKFRQQVEKGTELENSWRKLFAEYSKTYPELADEFTVALNKKLPHDWEKIWKESVPIFDPTKPLATREAQGKIFDALMPKLPLVIGGSADLSDSTKTLYTDAPIFSSVNPAGRYIHYGIREHGMGAIMNGIAATGILTPFGATYFCFTDYMRPAIRLAALAKYPVIFVYTHDSIGVGEDGPTHQPVEHLASFRAMPGLILIRPADANETLQAWKFALEHREGPVMLVLTRQKIPVIDQTKFSSAQHLSHGAYILKDTQRERLDLILLATGSEVHLALAAQEKLANEEIGIRVVSMPSWELFEQQTQEYRDSVLPPAITARVAIEAGVKLGWDKYIGSTGEFVGMTTFGASAPSKILFEQFGFTVENIISTAKAVLENSIK